MFSLYRGAAMRAFLDTWSRFLLSFLASVVRPARATSSDRDPGLCYTFPTILLDLEVGTLSRFINVF